MTTPPERKRGRPPAADNACGTYRGYFRHLRRNEPACRPCRDAHSLHRWDLKLAPQRRALLDAEVQIWERQRRRKP